MSDPTQSYGIVSALCPNGSQSYRCHSMLPVDQNGAAIVSASPVPAAVGYSCLVWSDANYMSCDKVRAISSAAIGMGSSP